MQGDSILRATPHAVQVIVEKLAHGVCVGAEKGELFTGHDREGDILAQRLTRPTHKQPQR